MEAGVQKTTLNQSREQDTLSRARARLFAAASRAHAVNPLSTEQLIQIRIALKRGRSKCCSHAGMDYAARQCILLANELERMFSRAGLFSEAVMTPGSHEGQEHERR
jgi:hypothetical protein